MNIFIILMIAVGLAMDSFAVAVAGGCLHRNLKLRGAMKIALFFGVFQAMMPVIGWLGGFGMRDYIAEVDHWLAFILLSFVGGKMIVESFKLGDKRKPINIASVYMLFLLAVATSIDALIVGFSLSFLDIEIFMPAVIIGIVTFLFSLFGVYLGKKVGHIFENKIEFAGGLILIGIGLKVLLEHL